MAVNVSINIDTFLRSADNAEARTNLGLTALATTTPGANVASSLAQGMVASGPLAITGSNTFTGDQTTSKKIIFTGAYSTSVANLAFGDAGGGITLSGGNVFFNYGGAATAVINNVGVGVRSVSRLGFASGDIDAGPIVSFFAYGGAANTIQQGDNSPTPVDQVFKGPNGSGTNIQAGDLRLAPGQSTGNATPAVLVLQGTSPGSSGTSAQSLVDVLTILTSNQIEIVDGATISIGDTTGLVFGTGSEKLGFFGVTPVTQRGTNVSTGLDNAGSGTAVLEDTSFNGGIGTSAYTLGGLIASLKELGLLAQ